MAPLSDSDVNDIIEKFGGLRPMASKTGIPTTTIQGWKKRKKIPIQRYDELNQAAAKHDIDLTASLDLNVDDAQSSPIVDKPALEKQPITQNSGIHTKKHEKPQKNYSYQKDLEAMERRIKKNNYAMFSILCLLIGIAMVVILWPQKKPSNDLARITSETNALTRKVDAIEQSLPQKITQRLNQEVNEAVTKTQEIYDDNINSIQQRIHALEEQGVRMPNAIDLETFYILTKDKMSNQKDMAIIDHAVMELNALYQTAQSMDPEQTKSAIIDEARQQSASLQVALKDVPQKDLQAAVYLLALTKMRDTLNRNNEPFESDYMLLRKAVSSENPELEMALDRLAPAAEQGILTQEGLSNELKSLSGDMIAASLKGEDVSIADKARARLSEVINVEKNGQSIIQTPEQAIITKAQKDIDNGDIQGAIQTLQSLDNAQGNPALEDFIGQAQNTLHAHKVQALINDTLSAMPMLNARKPYRFEP